MSATVTMAQYISKLRKIQADVPKILAECAEIATKAAVETVVANTPPNKGDRNEKSRIGVNMVSGELAQSFQNDSVTTPEHIGNQYVTTIRNNKEYASYVNDGHRLDKHFVPGLYIDKNGVLNRNADGTGGLVVGTKTKFVHGEFMVEKGEKVYEEKVTELLKSKIEELMND